MESIRFGVAVQIPVPQLKNASAAKGAAILLAGALVGAGTYYGTGKVDALKEHQFLRMLMGTGLGLGTVAGLSAITNN